MIEKIFLILLIFQLIGCASIGPDIIQASGNDYNVAIQRTSDEQLLLNLVRLKYRDTPFFLEVNSVSSQFKLFSEAGISANFKKQNTPETVGLSGKLSFTEQPTVTYLPLHGDEFIQKLLAPISLETILLLANSGWSVERILRLTVQNINGIPNAPTASGPTPKTAPEYIDFLSIASLFRELQSKGAFQLAYKKTETDKQATIVFNKQEVLVTKLREKLNLDTQTSYKLSLGQGVSNDKQSIVLSTRSLLGVMYFLSHSVNVPEKDKLEGKVTITQDASGEEYDWHDLTQGLFKINSTAQINKETAVGTSYRGSWFYIDDSDLDTKSTFSLLTQLFSLQSGNAEGITPVLTLPIGN